MQFEYTSYKTNPVQCPLCKWQGIGRELQNDEYHGESNILDLNCPQCNQHIGFTQFPTNNSKPYDREEDKKYW